MKDKFIKFFLGKTSQDEELELMKWARESKENEEEIIRSLNLFHAIHLLSDAESKTGIGNKSRMYLYIRRLAAVAAIFVGGVFFSYWFLNDTMRGEPVLQQITVPKGQRVNLALADGTEVWLNSLTTIKYDPTFRDKNRMVYLDGEAYFEVKANKHKPFMVRTDRGEIKVLGTKFNVEAYSGGDRFVTSLLEGSIALQAGGKNILLKPLQMATLSGRELKVARIESLDEYSWRNGIITFTDASFEELMRKFEKYYGYKIQMENLNLKTYRCSGKFRLSDGINYALNVLKETLDFTYERDMTDSVITIK